MGTGGTDSLVFIADLTTDRGSRMNTEAYRASLPAPIQSNETDRKDAIFSVQMDIKKN